MSEHRTPDKTVKICLKNKAKRQGNKTVKIELFKAGQFKHSYKPYKKHHFNPVPAIHPFSRLEKSFWQDHYRIRIDGRWVSNNGFKYCFFTLDQVMDIVKDALDKS